MSERLALQRCWNHSAREAVARCPECSRFYCRECVVEHDDRLICNSCLARSQRVMAPPPKRISLAPLGRVMGAVLGFILAWILFFSLGRMLLSIPDEFHAETLWKRSFSDDFNEGRNE
jgi:hypothetical protein